MEQEDRGALEGAVEEILRALQEMGITTRPRGKPLEVKARKDFGSVAVYYKGSALVVRRTEDGDFETFTTVIAPRPRQYYDLLLRRLVPGSAISVGFAAVGETPEEALEKLKAEIEMEAPKYVDVAVQMIRELAKSYGRIVDVSYDEGVRMAREALFAIEAAALGILDLAELLNADIDVESLRRRVLDATTAYHDAARQELERREMLAA